MQAKPDMKVIMTDVGYLLTIAASFFSLMGIFYVFFFIQVFASFHGLPQNLAFYSLAILNGASVFGRTIPNFIADKYGPFNLIISCTVISAGLVWVFLACTSKAGIICIAIFYGFFSGAYVSLVPSCIAAWANSLSEIGVRLGISFAISGIGALIGSPITGYILGDTYDWWKASTFSGICLLAAAICLIIARAILVKKKGTSKV